VTVNFDGSNSKDYDGTLVQYMWDFEDQYSTEKTAEGVKVSHKFTMRSSYTITLTIVDNDGEIAMDTLIVTVN
jgi:PKD repeat protein